MAMNSESRNTLMRLWLLLHRTAETLARCEDSVFGEYGLTTEQFTVLAALKGSGGPLRPVDLAFVMERSPNSVSMLVDRMVKAGLVRRTRDRKDRRAVKVTSTSKGEKALEPATPAGWELVQRILSPLSEKEKQALASLLELVKCECLGYLNPEADMVEIRKKSVRNRPDLYERMARNVLASGSKARRQVVERKKASR
jgi:DNA-binding MarR family transcriptional regulator